MTLISACVVAYNRDSFLRSALSAISLQSRKLDLVIVVDNACQNSTKEICKSFGATYISGSEEYGSAGGFAAAISESISRGADLVWLLDDDGLPSSGCLSSLLSSLIELDADAVSPLSVSSNNLDRTSNSFWLGLRKTDERTVMESKRQRQNKIQFYNGVLLKKELVSTVGVPDTQLFMRGDEMEYFRRCKRAKMRMYLCTDASFMHPSSEIEYAISRNSFFSANVPLDAKKRHYQFRNRGYLVRKYHLLHHLIYDWIRYPVTFLIFRKFDFLGLISWARLYMQGMLKILRPYREAKEI